MNIETMKIEGGRTVADARRLALKANRISIFYWTGPAEWQTDCFGVTRSAFLKGIRHKSETDLMPCRLQRYETGSSALLIGVDPNDYRPSGAPTIAARAWIKGTGETDFIQFAHGRVTRHQGSRDTVYSATANGTTLYMGASLADAIHAIPVMPAKGEVL